MGGVSAGLVIVLNILGNEQSGLADSEKEHCNLQKCVTFLKQCERRCFLSLVSHMLSFLLPIPDSLWRADCGNSSTSPVYP
jgi:hypothetical protein